MTIDADIQNISESIPDILEALKEFDVVCGWRIKRQDLFTKIVPSKIYNGRAPKNKASILR